MKKLYLSGLLLVLLSLNAWAFQIDRVGTTEVWSNPGVLSFTLVNKTEWGIVDDVQQYNATHMRVTITPKTEYLKDVSDCNALSLSAKDE